MAIIPTGHQEVSEDISVVPQHHVGPSAHNSDVLADL